MTTSEPPRTTARRVPGRLVLAGLALAAAVALVPVALGHQRGPFSSTTASSSGLADGAVPEGASVFDDRLPAVAKLDPALLRAVRRAATDAAEEGVGFVLNSGWRSREDQARLLRDAISTYGSEQEASRWVATPDTSAHVLGDAVDIGPAAGWRWLSEHGSRYWLCQSYDNEPWHYELRPAAVAQGCPGPYPDPTHDPRMHG